MPGLAAMLTSSPKSLGAAKAALLVIAHPDDESMFFAPALQHLRRAGAQLWVLCLSKGNGGGLGHVREKELLEACRVLQVPPAHVTIVEDVQLQDGMAVTWPADAVAAHAARHLQQHPCDTVLTFDGYGVSGHINHRGVHVGVAQLLVARGRQLGVRQAWALVSEALLHKYSCVLAVPLAAALRAPDQALLLGGDVATSVRAMAAHASQWVWYRKLFVLLSSYTYINRLQPLPLG